MNHADRLLRSMRHLFRQPALAPMLVLAAAALLSACSGGRPPLLSKVLDAERSGKSAPIVTATPRTSGRGAEAVASRGTVEPAEVGEIDNVIYFGPDRYQVEESYLPLLQAHAERLLGDPALQLRIDAFTDDVGPSDYNLELSRMRAVMVQRQLRALGVPARQLQIVAHGPGRKDASSSATGSSGTRTKASSRRVELNYR